MLAFSLALLLEMPRPYWAMASVYITSSQLIGATWSKAVYRMLGTLIGAAGTILLIPNLVNAPELLSIAIALWVGAFLYLSLIDGTPRSYVFMLAGYTVALLGFPILSTPQLTFDIVSARVQEILLGIACASVFSILVLPRTVAATIAAKADAWLDGARRLAIDTLTRRDNNQERDSQRMQLAAAASEIDQLSRHLGYEVSTSANIARGLQRLQQHMLWLLPLLAAIEDRQTGIASHAEACARMAALSARVANWLAKSGQADQEATQLCSSLGEELSQLDADATWVNAMTAAYALRLRNLIDITVDCRLLRNAIADGGDTDFLPLAFIPDTWTASIQHRDYRLALWSAATVAFSILACCTFWIATGWVDGESAAIFAAVVGSLFAGVDDPLPTYRNFYKIILLVIAVNGIYMFGILPRVTTLEMLIAALMPAFVLFGWMSARPATARAGTFLAIFTSVQLALNSSYTGDFASFANGSVSLFFGVVLTAIVSGIVRLSVSEWVAERLLSSNWKTLATVTEGRTWQQSVAIASLMQHRLTLLAARITVVPAEARSNAAHLRQLRTALNIIDLGRANPELSYHARRMIDALLDRLGSAFRTQTAGRLSSELVGPLDDAIAITLQEVASPARNEALIALTGMRFGLFPKTPEYEPHEPQEMRLIA